jgi:hypothetical protein
MKQKALIRAARDLAADPNTKPGTENQRALLALLDAAMGESPEMVPTYYGTGWRKRRGPNDYGEMPMGGPEPFARIQGDRGGSG